VTLGHDDLTNRHASAGKEVEGLAVLDRRAAIRQLTLDLNTSTQAFFTSHHVFGVRAT